MQTVTDTGEFTSQQILTEADLPKITAKCIECGREFTTKTMLLLDRPIVPSACEACADKRDQRILEWVSLCPVEFRIRAEGGGYTRLEKMDEAAPGWRKILDWKFGHRGLLIRGESGRCKTRAMWRLLRRLFDERKKFVALTAAEFDRQCRDAGGNYTLSEWFDRLAQRDVLFLDDIGKGAWTQATEAQIFDLIDCRTRNGKPILATSNDSGASLAARLSEDRGGPLVRRLRDYCDTLVFSGTVSPTNSNRTTQLPYTD